MIRLLILLMSVVALAGQAAPLYPRIDDEQFIIVIPPTSPDPPGYFVRKDGSNSNDGKTNTAGGAWLTIDWGLDHVAAGDIVRVQPGTYSERITPNLSGTAGSPITLIADGAVTFCGGDYSSDNYIRIIGFTVDTDAGCTKANRVFSLSGTNTGLEFWNNTMRDANTTGIGHGSFADRQHNTVIIGNIFTGIGPAGPHISLRGDNNFIAYNESIAQDPDAYVIDGTFTQWLNNYFHDVLDTTDAHSDIFQSGSSSLGLQFNLYESNFMVGNGSLPNEHGVLSRNASSSSCSTGTCADMKENLYRYNVWHHNSGSFLGIGPNGVGPITESRVVHDTVVDMMRNAPTVRYGASFVDPGVTARFHNTIFYRAWGQSATSLIVFVIQDGASIASADFNLAFTPDSTPTYTTPWTTQANELSNVDPQLNNHAGDDFTIASGSGARNAGGPLTITSGSGSGTTFNVISGGGGFFRSHNANISAYGGELTTDDVITVGTDVVTVTSVSGDAITVTPSFTWANAENVYLGNDTTPDIGAYPYKASGYSLSATYSTSGGTVTVTPNDASLVRFVICYEYGIPTTVDRESPYTCSTLGGTLNVRVYPRYASKTLWAVATP